MLVFLKWLTSQRGLARRIVAAGIASAAMMSQLAGCSATSANSPTEPGVDATTRVDVAPAPITTPGRPEADASQMFPLHSYTFQEAHQVDGRQGIAYADGHYFVSGSTTLSRYGAQWELEASATNPFEGFEAEVNHIGDIDAYDGEIYAGVEHFLDGEARNIQIAVYDAQTLELTRTYPFAEDSGQTEVSGIAVDPQRQTIWMCSWADGESGRYLYRYSLETGEYVGKTHLQAPPQWIQGIACRGDWLYLTADDGTADAGESDHVYRCSADTASTAATVTLERTLDDVPLQGEIEGISFDDASGQMLVSYNRGAQIVLGMPVGFYEGYDEEVHEVLIYAVSDAPATTNGPTEASTTEDALLTDTTDIALRDVYGDGSTYAFDYAGSEFSAQYTEDNWKIYDSYRISNEADITTICQALIDEHPIHGKDMQSYRTAEDMAHEWLLHNYAWKHLPEDSEWRQNAKDVDLDPTDQGLTLEEMYKARTAVP